MSYILNLHPMRVAHMVAEDFIVHCTRAPRKAKDAPAQ